MYKQIVIFYTFTLLKLSAGMTEFPCKFPCPWHNKTFEFYSSVKTTRTWRFNADGQTLFTRDSMDIGQFIRKCYQITERFIILRDGDSQYFRCYPIYYNPEIPLEFILGIGGIFSSINQTGEFTDLCEFCKEPSYTWILSATGPPSISTLSLDCTRPSGCSPPGKVCNTSDTIPKACPTTATPTITADPKTKKSHCGKKKHSRP
ncbi:uncharacterized protein LOC127724197 isoform X1 [Mytilus californianus]|uniref:uncharacterized protein LOC127724197 isoform X1 n=1 Tax=Mytilus californianus TaxID=6549 RepID=UPI002245C1D9|nr:uncharacterized protein LOC127724197 isoform X1 [Mytilus californianus]